MTVELHLPDLPEVPLSLGGPAGPPQGARPWPLRIRDALSTYLPLLARAGFACAPANAHAEAKALAHHVTMATGGHGAARECCDLLLVAAGRYAALLQAHLGTLDAR